MGHPVLRTPARAIEPADIRSPRIQQLIDDMFETMTEYQGVGLAAPQIHESLRLFVAGFAPVPGEEDDEMERVPLMALINPEITPVGAETVDDWEGCLSIPDIRGKVPRARRDRGAGLRSARQAPRDPCVELHRAGDSARDRSSERGAVLRSHEGARDSDLPRGVRPLLVGTRRRPR